MLQLTPININSTMRPKTNKNGEIKPYFYIINYSKDEKNLCTLEMKCLFNKVPKTKHFFSFHYVKPSRSPFIKQCISIIYTGSTLNDILHKITADNLSYENFKVSYINYENENLGHDERRKIEYSVGMKINGESEMNNPEVLLGITKLQDKWIFGEYEVNELPSDFHNKKPFSYSNALGVRVARSIINIAVSNNLKYNIIDPCCGIGTVVLEGLYQGFNIRGYEINPMIAANAKKNLQYFGYENAITTGDMHTIEDKFDVSIVDIPYGLFSPTTLKEQVDIIRTARRISDKMVIITFEDMDAHITQSGFRIVDRCDVSKGKFKRYITVCK